MTMGYRRCSMEEAQAMSSDLSLVQEPAKLTRDLVPPSPPFSSSFSFLVSMSVSRFFTMKDFMLLTHLPSFLNSPLSILSNISLVFLFSSLILFNKASIWEMFLSSFSSLCCSPVSMSPRPSPLSQTPENCPLLSSHCPPARYLLLCKLIFRLADNSPVKIIHFCAKSCSLDYHFLKFINFTSDK